MTPRRPIASITLALLLVTGCRSGGGAEPPAARSTGTGTPAVSPTPARTAAPFPGTPKGWSTYVYSSAGLRFAFPPLKGRITESSRSKTGVRHSWIIRRTDRCNPRGECRSYEFAAVNDGCPESAPWPTFAHRWAETETAHRISTCDGRNAITFPKALRTIERTDGLRGIIYDADVWFGSDVSVPGAIAAVLNFPRGYHERYEAVAFYFDDPISLDVVQRVLELVRLSR